MSSYTDRSVERHVSSPCRGGWSLPHHYQLSALSTCNPSPCSCLFAPFSSVQSLSVVRLFETPWTAARQASLSITNSWNVLRLTSIESVMPSNHLILCCPLLLLPAIFSFWTDIFVFNAPKSLRGRSLKLILSNQILNCGYRKPECR